LIRGCPAKPCRRSIQATGAPSGVAMSAPLMTSRYARSREALTTTCALQMAT
jgi:hypothetical protein